MAHVVDKSMEPSISDGSYYLFYTPVESMRRGKTAVVQLSDATNPDFDAIVLSGANEGELQVIAELVEMLRAES